jgi:hypothetical protein
VCGVPACMCRRTHTRLAGSYACMSMYGAWMCMHTHAVHHAVWLSSKRVHRLFCHQFLARDCMGWHWMSTARQYCSCRCTSSSPALVCMSCSLQRTCDSWRCIHCCTCSSIAPVVHCSIVPHAVLLLAVHL